MALQIRPARLDETDALGALISASAHALSRGDYTTEQVDGALQGVFGVDTQLIRDGTYFVVEVDGRRAACGGWSFRATLFGNDAIGGRDPRRLDPATDAARIRAFFVHPDYARRGIGRALLEHCENAARAAGFSRAELGATLPGLRLYAALGYVAGEPVDHPMENGLTLRVVPMAKPLT